MYYISMRRLVATGAVYKPFIRGKTLFDQFGFYKVYCFSGFGYR